MTNIVGLDKDEETLDKLKRQLGMTVKKADSNSRTTPKKVVKSSTKYYKKTKVKKVPQLQYDNKKKEKSLVDRLKKYLKKN